MTVVFQPDLSVTYDEYLAEVRSQLRKRPEWRVGQTFFNVLFMIRPDLSERVRTTELDPFYTNGRLPAFHEFVLENW